jgi:hypothetical protein
MQMQADGEISSGAVLADFYAFAPTFTGGVFVAAGDVNGDGRADIITGAGPGGGPEVKVYSPLTGALVSDFFAYAPTFGGGARVAAADVNGDGRADIITGAGPGGGAQVNVVDGTRLGQVQANGEAAALLDDFFAFAPGFAGGVFVG